MNIQQINGKELTQRQEEEGLILQGCGGNLEDWVNGINELLTEEGVLQEETTFQNVFVFRRDNLTCLYFPFDDKVKLSMGKLAMWRLKTYEQFGGTWLSDYVENRLGGFAEKQEKPDCVLIGQDGNVLNLVGIAAHTLRRNHMGEQAKEMTSRVFHAKSYGEALGVIGEYVHIVGEDESEEWKEEDGNLSM
jgi:hypothetical protein